jgi:hypothetical protein
MPAAAPSGNVFRKEGEYWTIVYHDEVMRLRDTKGLRYIAHLLCNPGVRFAARQIMHEVTSNVASHDGLPADPKPDTADADPLHDERARLGVTKRIKASIRTIATHHAALGYHLGLAVKTGAYCVYLPDPEQPIEWVS